MKDKSNKPITWNEQLDQGFDILKEHVCLAPTLILLDPSKPFEVKIETSSYWIGIVLYQGANLLHLRVNKTYSMLILTSRKRIVCIHIHFKNLKTFLYGNRFVVTTDPKCLKYFCDHQDSFRNEAWWAELIKVFSLSIRYLKILWMALSML